MSRQTFKPKLSDRAANLARGQVWEADDGRIIDGPSLLRRASSYGWANEQYFLDSQVGEVLKTGVSWWKRTT